MVMEHVFNNLKLHELLLTTRGKKTSFMHLFDTKESFL